MGCRERTLGDCTRLIMGGLEEELKVGKESDQAGLGRKKCGKIKGEEGVAVCKLFAGWYTCLTIPCT